MLFWYNRVVFLWILGEISYLKNITTIEHYHWEPFISKFLINIEEKRKKKKKSANMVPITEVVEEKSTDSVLMEQFKKKLAQVF